MPFAASPLQDEEQKKNTDGVNVSGGAGANFSTGVPGQESKQQKSSGTYANIQSYLDANKDQAQGMGEKIASNVSTQAEDASQKISGLSTQAPKVAAYDPNEAYKNATSLNDQQKSEYKKQKETGGYSGPQTVDQVQGYGDVQQAASKASTAVKNAGSETGQQELLKQTYARPQYSAGENRLDQALLQGNQQSRQALEGVSNKYAGLDSLFNKTAENVGGAINQANTQALANKQAIQTGEKNALSGLINPIQQRADQMNKDNPALIGRVQEDAKDFELNDETLKLLGLSEGQNVYDLSLGNYINPNPLAGQVGLNQAATADERAKYAALAGLFGDQSMNQIDANGQAINPVSFDKERLDKDVASKKSEVEDIVKNKTMYRSYNGSANATIQQAKDQIMGNIARGSNVAGNQAILNDILKQEQEAYAKYGANNVIKKGK